MTDEGLPLPAEMAERLRRFHDRNVPPATPRRAATVVLLRPAGTTFQVYVIRRAVSMVFGGVYAFPGGGVDPADAVDGLAGWDTRLGLPPAEAGAVVRAAAREVFEEAGVLLAGPRPGTVVGDVSGPGWEADRRSLAAHDLAFSDLLTRRGLRLRDDLLTGWARWITPEFEPRRFDTYFFLAVLPEGQRTRDVSGEADRTAWLSPADAVAGHAAGDLPMLPPTVVTLRELSAYRSIAGATAAAAERDVARPVLPKVEPTPDGGARMVLS